MRRTSLNTQRIEPQSYGSRRRHQLSDSYERMSLSCWYQWFRLCFMTAVDRLPTTMSGSWNHLQLPSLLSLYSNGLHRSLSSRCFHLRGDSGRAWCGLWAVKWPQLFLQVTLWQRVGLYFGTSFFWGGESLQAADSWEILCSVMRKMPIGGQLLLLYWAKVAFFSSLFLFPIRVN